jgi:hypothetical protein
VRIIQFGLAVKPVMGMNAYNVREKKILVVAADDDLVYTVFIGPVALEIL